MPQVSFPAVPFNGGTISMNSSNSHVCRLSGNRYITICSQFNPQYTIASVVTLNNAKSTTPTVTVLNQQVIHNLTIGNANANSEVRMVPLNSNSVLVIKSDTANPLVKNMNVLSVDSTTNEITCKLVTDVTLVTQPTTWGFYSSGVAITAIRESDNNILIAYRTTANQAKIVRVSYDTDINNLTITDIHTFALHSTAPYYNSLKFVKVPAGGIMLYLNISATSYNVMDTAINKIFYIADGVNSATPVYDVTRTGSAEELRRKTFVPFNSTSGLFTNGQWMQHFDTGVFGQSVTITNAITPSYSFNDHSILLNDEYFICLSINTNNHITNENGVFNIDRGFRVVKYTDPNYAICSPSTVGNAATQAGAVIPAAYNWFIEMPMLDFVDPELIVIPALGFSNTFTFRTIWLTQ